MHSFRLSSATEPQIHRQSFGFADHLPNVERAAAAHTRQKWLSKAVKNDVRQSCSLWLCGLFRRKTELYQTHQILRWSVGSFIRRHATNPAPRVKRRLAFGTAGCEVGPDISADLWGANPADEIGQRLF